MGKTDSTYPQDDYKDKGLFSKMEHDLYHDEDNVVTPVIHVKRIGSNAAEKWKVFENNKVVFVIESDKLSEQECDFLRTVDGINFFIGLAKKQVRVVDVFKDQLKAHLDSLTPSV
jgi:hypothetical protein